MTPLSWAERSRLFVSRGGVLGTLLDRLAGAYGDRRMVEQPGGIGLAGGAGTLTFRQAAGVVERVADLLEPRLAGRRVVVSGANGYDFFLTCLAVSRAGGVFVPVNPQMSEDEVAYVVEDAGGVVLEVDQVVSDMEAAGHASRRGSGAGRGWFSGRWRRACPRPSDVAAILYTSGTTGHPKGAVLSHRGLLDQPSRMLLLSGIAGRYELVVGLPVAHIMGLVGLLGAAIGGVPTFFMPRFHPVAALDALESRKANAFLGVPAMYRMMLDAGAQRRDLRSVRLWMSAADVMPEDLALRFKKMGATVAIPGIDLPLGEAIFAEGYGMVELSGVVTIKISPPYTGFGLGDFMGIPLPPYRYRVVGGDGRPVRRGTVGELVVTGPGVLREYHANTSATADAQWERRWIRTGDLVRRGPLGIIHFAGRKKEVIKHGGYSVFPAEIEAVLRRYPGVADAAVIGRPDPVKGEVPVAFLEAVPGNELDAGALEAYARQHLSDYKIPVTLSVVDRLPRTGTNKVARQVLKAWLRPPAAGRAGTVQGSARGGTGVSAVSEAPPPA